MHLIENLRARRDREEGFTLIELMVVVLIIAILIAIAIPTFLGARQRAQDKSAQSSTRNAITAAKTIFTDQQDYADATAATLLEVEPALSYVASNVASSGPKDISFDVTDANANVPGSDTFYAVALSKSDKCWAMRDVQDPNGATTEFSEVGGGACTADAAQVAANVNWSSDGF